MTVITVKREDGRISEVVIKGHSGYAKSGRDIVCAAVSAIAQTALLGLVEYSQEKVDYTVGEDGFMRFTVPEGKNETERARLETIAETMVLGLKDVRSGYEAFVKLEER